MLDLEQAVFSINLYSEDNRPFIQIGGASLAAAGLPAQKGGNVGDPGKGKQVEGLKPSEQTLEEILNDAAKVFFKENHTQTLIKKHDINETIKKILKEYTTREREVDSKYKSKHDNELKEIYKTLFNVADSSVPDI